MKIAIRDDDVNYFTTPMELTRNYETVWDVCPVSFSAVPFHACTKTGAIPEKYWSGDRIFPIGENKELVQFLKEKISEGKLSITLHGYSHKDNPDGYEFETGLELRNKIRQGKQYLESLFEIKIRTFVPPHNTVSKEGLKAVIDNGLNLVNIPSFRFGKRPFSIENFAKLAEVRFFHWTHKNGKYPYVLNFSDHKEVGYHTLTPLVSLDSLKNDFDFFYTMNGVFVLATHYWEFPAKQTYDASLKMGEVFREFWEYVRDFDDIKFVSVDGIFEESIEDRERQ